MYDGGTSWDVPPSVFDGCMCHHGKQPRHHSRLLRWRGACWYVWYSLRFSLFEVECSEVGGVGYYRAWQFVVAHACELVACTTEQVQFCYLCALECHIVNVYCKVLKLHCGVGFRCCCWSVVLVEEIIDSTISVHYAYSLTNRQVYLTMK